MRLLTRRLRDDEEFKLSRDRFSKESAALLYYASSTMFSGLGSIEGLRDTLLLTSKIADHISSMEKEIGPSYNHEADPILSELFAMTPSGFANVVGDIPAMGSAANIHDMRQLSNELFDAAKLCTIAMQRAKELGETDERVVGFERKDSRLQHVVRLLYPTLKI